jgi:Putative transposase/Transposase zinc-binding domain
LCKIVLTPRRTDASPTMQVKCTGCDHQKLVPHSCGHRHCPHCQHHESQQWLERQLKKPLPAEYFLLTFILPAEFRALARAHQSVVYAALMQCCVGIRCVLSARTTSTCRARPAPLRSCTRIRADLIITPHVHLVMPASALDGKHWQWRTKQRKTKGGYLFNHKALAKVFRAKMLAAIEAAGLTLPQRHSEQWVVDCKSVGSGDKVLIYLGRYLYRGVIAEKDIVACGNGQVSFRYRNAKTGKMESRTESGAHFLWLVLQHVLPKGFRRARNFGFLHPNCKRLIALLHLLLKFDLGHTVAWFKERAPIPCACCGAVMVIVKTQIRSVLRETMPAAIVTHGAVTV